MIYRFFENVKTSKPIARARWDEFAGYFTRIEVPGKTILLKEGEISRKGFLIEKGCMRAWFNNNGKDISFQFFFENEFVSSAESFRKNIPSFVTIETVEPCVIHQISKEKLNRILNEIMEVPELRERMTSVLFDRQLNYMKHFVSFIKETPRERYQNLLKEKPHIIQRIPQQHIASYLGITPVSLSRIRNNIRQN
jgi:CRP-like cAMP-binding protein